MKPTASDQDLAGEASAILTNKGRPDLTVTPGQVVRWRYADLLPILSDRRPGRGRRTAYELPNAAVVAAEIRLALDDPNDLDRAAVVAFVRGAGVAEKGLHTAFIRTLRQVEQHATVLLTHVDQARTEVRRSLRFPLPHSRRAGAALVAKNALALVLGEATFPASTGTALAVEGLLPAQAWEALADCGEPQLANRLDAVLEDTNAIAMRRVVRRASLADLRWACEAVDAIISWARVVSELVSDTSAGTEAKLDPRVSFMAHAGVALESAFGRETHDLGIAYVAIGCLTHCSSNRDDRHWLNDWAEACRRDLPARRQALALVHALPEHLRPALAPEGGPEFQERLAEADRALLSAIISDWLDQHREDPDVLSMLSGD